MYTIKKQTNDNWIAIDNNEKIITGQDNVGQASAFYSSRPMTGFKGEAQFVTGLYPCEELEFIYENSYFKVLSYNERGTELVFDSRIIKILEMCPDSGAKEMLLKTLRNGRDESCVLDYEDYDVKTSPNCLPCCGGDRNRNDIDHGANFWHHWCYDCKVFTCGFETCTGHWVEIIMSLDGKITVETDSFESERFWGEHLVSPERRIKAITQYIV